MVWTEEISLLLTSSSNQNLIVIHDISIDFLKLKILRIIVLDIFLTTKCWPIKILKISKLIEK